MGIGLLVGFLGKEMVMTPQGLGIHGYTLAFPDSTNTTIGRHIRSLLGSSFLPVVGTVEINAKKSKKEGRRNAPKIITFG